MTYTRAAIALLAALLAPAAFAGTQDFVLSNQSGVEIHNLYISESGNENWEEDVLGENVLSHGSRANIQFAGRSACEWDILVADAEGGNVTWTGIDLCAASVVVLHCNEGECWAEIE